MNDCPSCGCLFAAVLGLALWAAVIILAVILRGVA